MLTASEREQFDQLHAYWHARREHAYRLRLEHLTYKAIGQRLGIGKNQARQQCLKEARIIKYRLDRAIKGYDDARDEGLGGAPY
jgi:hypothetical protein